MKKHIKIIFTVFILIVFLAYGIYAYMKPKEFEGFKIFPKTAELYFTEKGTVGTDSLVSIFPISSGEIKEIYVKENDFINNGTPICKVDTSNLIYDINQQEAQIKSFIAQKSNLDLEEKKQKDNLVTTKNQLLKELETIDTQKYTSEESKVEQEKLNDEQLRLQKIVLAQNEADIKRSQDDLDKMTILFTNGVISENELNQYKEIVDKYKSAFEQNKQQLQVIEAGLSNQNMDDYYEATKNAIKEQIKGIENSISKSYTSSMKEYYDAQIQSATVNIEKLKKFENDSVIKSNVSGKIIDLPIEDSNVVVQGSPIAIVDNGKTYVMAYVSTRELNSVEVDKDVELILKRREGDEFYKGKIKKIEDEAETKISSLGIEERKVKVYVEPESETEKFKKGFDVDVKILVFSRENSITIPKLSVFKDTDNLEKVWKVEGDKLVKVVVEKGIELQGDYVIESGLLSGDIVIPDASLEELKENLKVKINVNN